MNDQLCISTDGRCTDMANISVTLEVSHAEMSALKLWDLKNLP